MRISLLCNYRSGRLVRLVLKISFVGIIAVKIIIICDLLLYSMYINKYEIKYMKEKYDTVVM